MRIVCGIREGDSLTNFRAECFAEGFRAAGHKVVYASRKEPLQECEIYIQAGFVGCRSLRDAIERKIPYIIGEMPAFRQEDQYDSNHDHLQVSYQWNGLQGGGWYTDAPDEPRPHPVLLPVRQTNKSVLIIGQKGNDMSLRGCDHHAWLRSKLSECPEAEFRPHPLMVSKPMEPLKEHLARIDRVITFTSTVGVDAQIAGCTSWPEHWGSMAYDVFDRRGWIHNLSWCNFTIEEAKQAFCGEHILAGYEEACWRMERGMYETPRGKYAEKFYEYKSDDPRVTAWR